MTRHNRGCQPLLLRCPVRVSTAQQCRRHLPQYISNNNLTAIYYSSAVNRKIRLLWCYKNNPFLQLRPQHNNTKVFCLWVPHSINHNNHNFVHLRQQQFHNNNRSQFPSHNIFRSRCQQIYPNSPYKTSSSIFVALPNFAICAAKLLQMVFKNSGNVWGALAAVRQRFRKATIYSLLLFILLPYSCIRLNNSIDWNTWTLLTKLEETATFFFKS